MQMRWKIIDQLRVGRAVFVAPQTEGNPPFGLRTTAKLKGAVFDEALAVVA